MATVSKKTSALPAASPVGTEVQGVELDLNEANAPSTQLPLLPPSPPFYIAIHPNNWHVRDGLLMPAYKRIPLIAGVNGAVENASGPPTMHGATGRAADSGWSVIPTAWGPGGKSYLRTVQSAFGRATITAWDTARAGEDTTEFNRQAFHDWAWALVNSGKCPGPSAMGLRRLRASVADQNMRQASKAKISAEHEHRAAQTSKALAVVDALIAKLAKAAPVVASDMGDELE
jgi:hypothetical protein